MIKDNWLRKHFANFKAHRKDSTVRMQPHWKFYKYSGDHNFPTDWQTNRGFSIKLELCGNLVGKCFQKDRILSSTTIDCLWSLSGYLQNCLALERRHLKNAQISLYKDQKFNKSRYEGSTVPCHNKDDSCKQTTQRPFTTVCLTT